MKIFGAFQTKLCSWDVPKKSRADSGNENLANLILIQGFSFIQKKKAKPKTNPRNPPMEVTGIKKTTRRLPGWNRDVCGDNREGQQQRLKVSHLKVYSKLVCLLLFSLKSNKQHCSEGLEHSESKGNPIEGLKLWGSISL